MGTADHVRAGYDGAAAGYDLLLRRNREGAHRLVTSLPPGPFPRVLDVGCGTGFVSEAMARLRGARDVVGVDLSDGMLDGFRARLAAVDGVAATAVRADVADMPVEGGAFDAVVSGMAFHWFPDKPGAVRAMARALRPGGVLGILTSGRGTEYELRDVLAAMDPPAPQPLIDAFALVQRDQGEMDAMLRDAGLEPVDVWTETRLRVMDPDAFMDRVYAASGHLTLGMPEEKRLALADALRAAVRDAAGPDGFAFTFVKLFAVATRPD
ncbi:MAG: methyltransferase domain-containing protein [Actinomycetota bacterium]